MFSAKYVFKHHAAIYFISLMKSSGSVNRVSRVDLLNRVESSSCALLDLLEAIPFSTENAHFQKVSTMPSGSGALRARTSKTNNAVARQGIMDPAITMGWKENRSAMRPIR
jgi:hypothetical protein